MTPSTIAGDAIGLFLEYRDRHGETEEIAKAKAMIEVDEGTDGFIVVNAEYHAALVESLKGICRDVQSKIDEGDNPIGVYISGEYWQRVCAVLAKGEK